MYENCWLNLLVETVRQFRVFLSSLKMKKWWHCQVCHVTREEWVGWKKKVSYTKVQSGLNQSRLVHLLFTWLDHPVWSGGLHKWTLYSSGKKIMQQNCSPDSFLSLDKGTYQLKVLQSYTPQQLLAKLPKTVDILGLQMITPNEPAWNSWPKMMGTCGHM